MVFGTFESEVMQQGNCNTPVMFQRLGTAIFQDKIGMSVHNYLNDLFVYSNKVKDHKDHLRVVFQKLHNNQLFIE